MKLIYIKKSFQEKETGKEVEYNQFYLYTKSILGNYEFMPIQLNKCDRAQKRSLQEEALYFDNLVQAREYFDNEAR